MGVVGRLLTRYRKGIDGSFAIIFAVSILVILICVGAAYDISNMSRAKLQLQNSVDTAALAGAGAARDSDVNRLNIAKTVLTSNININKQWYIQGAPSIEFDDEKGEVTIVANTRVKTLFMGIIGKEYMPVKAVSTSGYAANSIDPFTIMLALDVSGSMGWETNDGEVRLDALKTATENLFQALYDQSENKDLLEETIRSGYAAYRWTLASRMRSHNGYRDTVARIKRLNALGGTNSAPAMQFTYKQLVSDSKREVQGVDHTKWTGYLIFMSDGNNNETSSDTKTLRICAKAKEANIKIFTIAFEAPKKGTELLQACASEPEYFYTSSNAQSLREAFSEIGRQIGKSTVRIKH